MNVDLKSVASKKLLVKSTSELRGQVHIKNTDQTVSASTGALVVDGGVYVNKLLKAVQGVDVNNAKIVNLATPTSSLDAVNKVYVDSLFALRELQVPTNVSSTTKVSTTKTSFVTYLTGILETVGMYRLFLTATFSGQNVVALRVRVGEQEALSVVYDVTRFDVRDWSDVYNFQISQANTPVYLEFCSVIGHVASIHKGTLEFVIAEPEDVIQTSRTLTKMTVGPAWSNYIEFETLPLESATYRILVTYTFGSINVFKGRITVDGVVGHLHDEYLREYERRNNMWFKDYTFTNGGTHTITVDFSALQGFTSTMFHCYIELVKLVFT